MINIKTELFSESLHMRTAVNVLLPEVTSIDKPLKTLYLLHGFTGNCNDWIRQSNLERIITPYNIAVIMPSVANSFYTDMKFGQKYFSYAAKELPEFAQKVFPLSDESEDRYIIGLSMGGYGAMKIALSNPSAYNAVASFSGVLDIKARVENKENKNPEDIMNALKACFGDEKQVDDKDDLFKLAEKLNTENCPKIYIACGTEDSLFPSNEKFVNRFSKACNIHHEYEPGAHEWWLWEKHLSKALEYFLEN